jgi:hypothetical protein
MAKSSGGGHAFSWALIGFLAGVAATLAVLIFIGGRPSRRDEAEAPRPVPAAMTRPAHRNELKPRAAEEAAPATPQAVDEQVAEDAAAAGMTSRSHSAAHQ